MSKDAADQLRAGAGHRLSLPRLERRHPWLALMLDAFSVVEASIAQAVAAAPAPPACRAGCIPCCRQAVIPLTPLEAETLHLWLREELAPAPRARVLHALRQNNPSAPPGPPVSKDCPFLLCGTCAAYPVRPIACRRFMVLSSPCGMGEDCLTTRPRDVLQPSREALHAALALTAPFYRRIGMLQEGREPDFAFFTRISLNVQCLPFKE